MCKSNGRIAVVDDDASVRKALVRLLETSSYDAQGFPSACELLADLSEHLPDCLIVDLQMPDMNGLELQQYLAGAALKIPTVVITAHDEPGSRQLCLAAGAAAYLLKPVRKAALLAAISSAIKSVS